MPLPEPRLLIVDLDRLKGIAGISCFSYPCELDADDSGASGRTKTVLRGDFGEVWQREPILERSYCDHPVVRNTLDLRRCGMIGFVSLNSHRNAPSPAGSRTARGFLFAAVPETSYSPKKGFRNAVVAFPDAPVNRADYLTNNHRL